MWNKYKDNIFLVMYILFVIALTNWLAFNGYAQSACIFQGNDTFCMKPNLKFQTSNNRILTGNAADPQVVPTDGIPGDLYIRSTGEHYIKTDSGATINWDLVAMGTSVGDVIGPASSIDNTLAQFDGTTGKLLKETAWTVPNAIGSLGQYLAVVGGQDTGWTSLPATMVQVGGAPVVAGNLPEFGGIAGTQIIDSGVAADEVVTQVADSAAANRVKLSSGTDKVLIDSDYTVPITSCPNNEILKSDGTDFVCAVDAGGSGDVVGPASSITNTVASYADTTGKLLRNGPATYIDFINNQANPTYLEGRLFYSDADNALSYMPEVDGPILNIGQESWAAVRNNSGATILNGQAVRITGAIGQRPTIALAQANNSTNARMIGLATHDIANNSNGYVTFSGVTNDVNTSAFIDGDILYLSATVAGGLTTTPPDIEIRVGRVLFSHVTQGKIGVLPTAIQSNAKTVASPAAVVGGGTIALANTNGNQLIRLTSASAVTLATVPFTGNLFDGMTVTLVNVGTFTITVPYNNAANGVLCFGDIDLPPSGSATLNYSLTSVRWIEQSRSF